MSKAANKQVVTERNEHVPANTKHLYHITSRDLPLSCPMPEMELWNSHPRVYLPIDDSGRARCPYCSAEFILSDVVSLVPDQ